MLKLYFCFASFIKKNMKKGSTSYIGRAFRGASTSVNKSI